MELSKIYYIISHSKPEDWHQTFGRNHEEIYVYRFDVLLRLEAQYGTTVISLPHLLYGRSNVSKEITNDIPASHYLVDVFYGSSLIERITLLALKSHKAIIPIPHIIQKRQVKWFDYCIANICDRLHTLNSYMQQYELTISPQSRKDIEI